MAAGDTARGPPCGRARATAPYSQPEPGARPLPLRRRLYGHLGLLAGLPFTLCNASRTRGRCRGGTGVRRIARIAGRRRAGGGPTSPLACPLLLFKKTCPL